MYWLPCTFTRAKHFLFCFFTLYKHYYRVSLWYVDLLLTTLHCIFCLMIMIKVTLGASPVPCCVAVYISTYTLYLDEDTSRTRTKTQESSPTRCQVCLLPTPLQPTYPNMPLLIQTPFPTMPLRSSLSNLTVVKLTLTASGRWQQEWERQQHGRCQSLKDTAGLMNVSSVWETVPSTPGDIYINTSTLLLMFPQRCRRE